MKKIILVSITAIIICIVFFIVIFTTYNNKSDLIIQNKTSKDLYNVQLMYNDSKYIEPYGDIRADETAKFYFPKFFSEGNIWIKYENSNNDIIESELVGYYDTGFPQVKIIVRSNNGKLTFEEK